MQGLSEIQATLNGKKPEAPVRFWVTGTPLPKGNMRAFVIKGRAVVTYTNPSVKDWQPRIATEAQAVRGEEPPWGEDEAVGLLIDFYLPRPKSLPKKYTQHVSRPDMDKLVRAVFDALTDIFFEDDSQVNHLVVSKHYATDTPTGVQVQVWRRGI